jgi:hypothetical protein
MRRPSEVTHDKQFLARPESAFTHPVRAWPSRCKATDDLGDAQRDTAHNITVRGSTASKHAIPHAGSIVARSDLSQAVQSRVKKLARQGRAPRTWRTHAGHLADTQCLQDRVNGSAELDPATLGGCGESDARCPATAEQEHDGDCRRAESRGDGQNRGMGWIETKGEGSQSCAVDADTRTCYARIEYISYKC